MLGSRSKIIALGVVSIGLGGLPTAARAQFGGAVTPPYGGSSTTGQATGTGAMASSNMMMMANPYTNPYMNPFINPYMTQGTATTGNAAMYFFAAQQMNGGIGSGMLGGPRASIGRNSSASKQATASSPNADAPGGANTPGALASRYFNRTTPTGTGLKRYYGQKTKQYPAPGR